jgi:hypothetical protein
MESAQPLLTPLRAVKQARADKRAMNVQAERTADVRAVSGGAKHDDSSDEEMIGYGKQMGDMIRKQYGDRFHKHFMKGMGRIVPGVYGNPDVPGVPVGFSQNVSQKAHSALTPKQEVVLQVGMANAMDKPTMKKGKGKLVIKHMPEGAGEEIVSGGAATGRYEGQGKEDKRRSRGAMIKKIMAEKGLSLIEASRYLKEHGSA